MTSLAIVRRQKPEMLSEQEFAHLDWSAVAPDSAHCPKVARSNLGPARESRGLQWRGGPRCRVSR